MLPQRLTVLQLLPALESGGVERGTLEIANGLVKKGHRSLVISGGGRLVDQLTTEGSEHYTWPIGIKSPRALFLIPKLRNFLRTQKIDILHARSRVPAWIAWFAWKSIKKPLKPHFITTVHGLYSVNLYSTIMVKGEKIIAVSETAYQYIRTNYPKVSIENIELIPRGIHPEDYPYGYQPNQQWLENWYHTYPQLQDKVVLTLPGRLTPLKGHEDFIVLIEKLIQDQYPVHGLIVGDTHPNRQQYFHRIKQQILTRNLESSVTFTGHRKDMREIYANSHLVLSLSKKPESFGRTVLEALSLGIPTVGYDHGGVGEILKNLFPQGRIPLGEIDKLYDCIVASIKNSPRVPPLNQAYSLEAMINKTLACYMGFYPSSF
ncbi:glycosyltransferase family 4 protein [Candidatus Nitrosacidococcus tergens]|uniref:Glycosyl transferase group 1 n=1 Tax=Candidatus Nitrosacidococcus tergens TaxID=553981 RepID=A0A7G1QB08_9GAMM|nr:glycosyltransferase family 4 protein [Candidatus Nitrosacidococcus tergens]CAB1276863.1 Glycosyl transferase group 1 [Candidatus Nitrosacidococcus tergens]